MSYRERLDDATEAAIAEQVARQRKRFKPSDLDQAVLLLRAFERQDRERAQRQENAA
ncbi:hypothetical protein AB0H71_14000 [Nocardia sp. NPDC050697]|uniref:hypothetical protein n=1 Tax=Nocardia sp. NPDC050697 TaxID=3155158 RepID=UPI0033C83477